MSWGGRGEIHTHTLGPWDWCRHERDDAGTGLGVRLGVRLQCLHWRPCGEVRCESGECSVWSGARTRREWSGVLRGDEGGNSAEGGAKWRECVASVPGGSCSELREGRLCVEVEVDSPGGGSCTMSWACQSGEGGR